MHPPPPLRPARRAARRLAWALTASLALAGPLGACEPDPASAAPDGGPDALLVADGEDPGPVDTAQSGDQLGDPSGDGGVQGDQAAADGGEAPDSTSPDAGPGPLPACEVPTPLPPAVSVEAVDTDSVRWEAQGLTEWDGDVTVETLDAWASPAVGPLDGEAGWDLALRAGDSVYRFHLVVDGQALPFAVGDELHASLYVFQPQAFAQTARLSLTDSTGALALYACQGESCDLGLSIEAFECADVVDYDVHQGRGPVTFGTGLTLAPGLSGVTVPDRAATTSGDYLVLLHDAWEDPAPTQPPACTDTLQSWYQLAILPAP